MIRRHLDEELPFLATEPILMQAARRGGDRQALHERIRRHAVAAAERIKEKGEANDLVERIATDEEFGLSRIEVEAALDPRHHLGRAPRQVEEFLDRTVKPILKQYPVEKEAPELEK